jgi:hypothetical protein
MQATDRIEPPDRHAVQEFDCRVAASLGPGVVHRQDRDVVATTHLPL